MSCGLPVIGSDSGEIPTVLGDAGITFPEGDARSLAAQFRRLLSDPSLRAELGSKGRQRVLALYSLEQVAAQHQAAYSVLRTED